MLGQDALAPISFMPDEVGYVLWTILHDPNELGQIGGLTIRLSYPVLPWFGVILLGYFMGPVYAQQVAVTTRRNVLLGTGVVCLALLLFLRGLNLYGEALPWSVQDSGLRTLMSFLNFTKYPPSLNFMLITLGVSLLLLATLEQRQHLRETQREKPVLLFQYLQTFGSVPMFIYIVHLYVLLVAYWLLYAIFGATHGERFGLDGVGWIWLGASLLIVLHYPIAKAFSNYKHKNKHNQPWLSYL